MAVRVVRWGALALAVVALLATTVNLFLLPWGVAPFGVAPGWKVFGYAQSGFDFAGLSPWARAYFDQAGRFLPFVALSVTLSVGARSPWGRFGGGALALLGSLLAGLVAVTRATWPDEVPEDGAVRWFVTATMTTVALAVLVALVLRVLRRPLPFDLLAVTLLLALGVIHFCSVAALVSFPGNEFQASILAWTPAPLYLLAGAGAAVSAGGAFLRDRASRSSAPVAAFPRS